MTTTFAAKLENFRLRVECDQIARYRESYPNSNEELCRNATVTTSKPGTKYCKVDVGSSGKYMVEVATGNIFGIKGYGQVHKGHFYGTLDTMDEYFWGDYYPRKKDGSSRVQKANGCPVITKAPALPTVQAEPEWEPMVPLGYAAMNPETGETKIRTKI